MIPYSNNRMFVQPQDTTLHRTDTLLIQDTTSVRQHVGHQQIPVVKVPLEKLEEQMQAAEQRLRQIDSTAKISAQARHLPPPQPIKQQPRLDSTNLIIRSTQRVDRSLSSMIHGLTHRDPGRRPLIRSEKVFIQTGADTEYRTVREHRPIIRERNMAMLKEPWMLPVLFTAFILIIWVRIAFGRIFNKTLVSLWNRKAASELTIPRNTLYQRMNAFLLINYLITGTLFVYLSARGHILNIEYHTTQRLLVNILLALSGVFAFRWISTRLTGITANASYMMNEYFQYTVIFYHTVGIFLFPLVVLIPFISPAAETLLISAGILLIAALYLLRLFWLSYLFVTNKFSLFYLFLYLCALEILPLLLFIRLILI